METVHSVMEVTNQWVVSVVWCLLPMDLYIHTGEGGDVVWCLSVSGGRRRTSLGVCLKSSVVPAKVTNV